ncbi:MAG: hypothetical protein J6A21_00935 [Lentisphaeria bacterium]|nr:hypothetical protein [Lentisphaeria bacterium]
MVEITSVRQGAILNHNHGKETENALTILLEGFGSGRPVKVNGEKADMVGRRFSKEISLTEKLNKIVVSEQTPFGLYSQEIQVLWDKKSFKRYNCFIDDNVFLFTDLARERPKSAFDHFYLKALKKIHDKYGFKLTLNCFYRNDHDKSFTLDQMPDIWKQEFIDNSDWLKFSFHAKSEFPDRPYLESSAEEFGKDFDDVYNEIVRFAGKECYIAPTVIHWGNIHPTVAQECVRRGVTNYTPILRPTVMGGPSLAERLKGGDMSKVRTRDAIYQGNDLEGFAMYYENQEEKSYLAKYRGYYDPLMGLVIRGGGAVCCNLVPLNQIEAKVKNCIAAAESVGAEFINVATHEQYTFPYYCNYLPDHMERMDLAVRTVVEAGYQPVFFSEGFMGNMAWEK